MLTIVGYAGKLGKSPSWWCECSCSPGVVVDHPIRDGNLKKKKSPTTSCGCEQRRLAAEAQFVHGGAGTPIYYCWQNMIKRCTDPANPQWESYGGRDPHPVTVCKRWDNGSAGFVAFRDDMGGFQPPDMEIDRIDNLKGYWCGKAECAECSLLGRRGNCRWLPIGDSRRNKLNVRLFPYQGQLLTANQIADSTNGRIKRSLMNYRLKILNMTPEQAIATPVKKYKNG